MSLKVVNSESQTVLCVVVVCGVVVVVVVVEVTVEVLLLVVVVLYRTHEIFSDNNDVWLRAAAVYNAAACPGSLQLCVWPRRVIQLITVYFFAHARKLFARERSLYAHTERTFLGHRSDHELLQHRYCRSQRFMYNIYTMWRTFRHWGRSARQQKSF